jgi:hypothetical protein
MSRLTPAAGIGMALAILLSASPVLAQQSTSYRVESAAINDGGRPEQGVTLAGSTYRISLDAIGGPALSSGLGSASFRLDSGFVDLYAPPGEVMNQRFSDASTLTWDAEKSVGVYEVYRGLISGLPGGGFGTCFQSSLASPMGADAANPAVGDGWFYFVTARNRLGEEGTKGTQSSGAPRPNSSPCP